MTTASKTTALLKLKCYRKFICLEKIYNRSLLGINQSFEQTCSAYLGIEQRYRSIIQLVNSYLSFTQSQSTLNAGKLLEDYANEITTIHQSSLFWIKIYLTLVWPDEITSNILKKWANTRTKNEWKEHFKDALSSLDSSIATLESREAQLVRIKELTEKQHSLDPQNPAWFLYHRKLIDAVYDEMVNTINVNKQRMAGCFHKTYLRHAVGVNNNERINSICDWIDGYKQPSEFDLDAESKANELFSRGLSLLSRQRFIRLILRNAAIGLVAFAIFISAHHYQIDREVYIFVRNQTLRVLKQDPASLNLKTKKDYFNKYIVDIKDKISAEELRLRINEFNDKGMSRDPSGLYTFAEDILKPYFLHLSTDNTPKDLETDLLDTLGSMDEKIRASVEKISQMFRNKVIEDSKLRNLLLEMRRDFVLHNIFPFTFIVVKNDTPYLFMFPEHILQRFRFRTQQLEYIGFNSSYYSKFVRFPLRVFVVKGDRYPFKDRAGYFEGEFAVVFADIALRTEWSALHEFAHIIDQMRYMYGGKAFPQNIEINAMLLPLIFSQQPTQYMFERLFPIIETANTKDAYVQASKGIINGYLKLLADIEKSPSIVITDKFLPEDILSAKKIIGAKCNDSIRGAALRIYQHPNDYLKTAKAGQYKGIISNAEEIVAGTPRAPYQGFILGGDYSSSGETPSGIKFIFDNQDNQLGFFQGKNIFGIIQEIYFFMRHAQSSDVRGFQLMNFIAAVVDFVLIIGLFIGIHIWGAPIRKKKFYGPDFAKWFDAVYKNNPLSDGRGSGDRPGEKQVLAQVIRGQGVISDELRSAIKTLKSDMNVQRTALFDTLLTMAFFNPRMSAVRSKWHDFMFWFPYFGPVLARSPWLFPRQKAFRQWETFNERLLTLAKSIRPQTTPEEFRKNYTNIIKDFKRPDQKRDPLLNKTFQHLSELRQQIDDLLFQSSRADEQNAPVIARQLPWLSQQDGEFDHLASYNWHDDVKRIDWKATARSPNQEPKVRKYSGATSAHFDFLLDFRRLNVAQGREGFARDLIRSLNVLKNDNDLKALTIILPWGEMRQIIMNIKDHTNRRESLKRIWETVTDEFERTIALREALKAQGLIFYMDDENIKYRKITQLTELNSEEESVQRLERIATKSLNVYLIGVDVQSRHEIIGLLPKNQQPFYWE